ncbi:MAG: hypothetical protein ABI895_24750 [Deltaproteobacteria bacterium]
MREFGTHTLARRDAQAGFRSRGSEAAAHASASWSQERIPLPAFYIVVLTALVLGALYTIFAATVLPNQLRRAARRAGVRLEFGGLSSIYPRELHLEAVEMSVPGAGLELHAAALDVEPRWSSLFSTHPLFAAARGSQVELRWAKQSLGPFELRVETLGGAAGDTLAWVAIDGAATELALPGATLSFALEARLRVPHWNLHDGTLYTELGDGSVVFSGIRVAPVHGRERAAMKRTAAEPRATLRLDAGAISAARGFGVSGTATSRGPDAAIWLDLAGADSTVRWMLAELAGQPFQLQASFRACNEGADFDELHFESGLTEVSGALHLVQGRVKGELVARRGSLRLGLSVQSGAVAAHLETEPYSLDAELARQGTACAAVIP